MEAGLGLDAALARVAETTKGPLGRELELVLARVGIGQSRAEALERFARRVGIPEVNAFVRALAQVDQLGVSLGRTLRVHAADTRLRRQALAEEAAGKAPVKMLLPTVVFIFPALFVVLLAPALIALSRGL